MSEASTERIHSMDALRASTMLLLVPVHAAGLVSLNGHEGAWAVAIYWFVHVFRLPLFFAMSGFFLALLLRRKGLRETARNRTLRIVVPLAVGLVTLIPLMVVAAQVTGVALNGDGSVPGGSAFTFEPGFLWFLWYLLIIDAAAVALYLLAPGLLRWAGERLRDAVARPLTGVALLAVPTAAALWPAVDWVSSPAVDTFVPELPVLVYNALFFGLGATLCVHRELVAAASRDGWRWAACALVATVPAGLLFSLHNSPAGDGIAVHAAALLIYAIATWTSLMALVGLAARYLTRPRPALRYLADSSYWIYLSHMPAMVLLVALVGAMALGAAPRFALVTLGSLVFSLLTYPLFVRYTVIGRVLNGPRPRRRTGPVAPRPVPRAAPASAPSPR
jgi:peptidoglycan/LPS O-acetylase OafA/YrhL